MRVDIWSDVVGPWCYGRMLGTKYGMSPAQARQAEERLASLADAEGLGYEPERPVGNTFDIHRVIHLGLAKGVQRELLDEAYFAQARQVFDPAVITEVAAQAGLDQAWDAAPEQRLA